MMNSLVTERVSQHFRLLAAISSTFVVYIHAVVAARGPNPAATNLVYEIQSLLSYHLFHVSLPIFFIMASFFLFLGNSTAHEVLGALRRRIVSLCLPYAAWSGFWLCLVLILIAAGVSVPVDEERSNLLVAWLVVPLPGHLWFLRDLILLVVMAPVITIIPSRILAGLAFFTLCWWAYEETPTVLELRSHWWEVTSNLSLGWFLIGAVAARYSSQFLACLERGLSGWSLVLATSLWICLPYIPLPGELSHGLSVISGAILFLAAARPLQNMARSRLVFVLSGFSFTIYLGHHPMLGMIQDLLLKILPRTGLFEMLIYAFMPVFVILSIILLFAGLSLIVPRIVFVATGGRSLPALFPNSRRGNF